MGRRINNISIKGLFWGRITDQLISFQFSGIPKNIHFSVSWDSRSSDINFHITKNTSNQRDKPQIKIAVFDKKELIKVIPVLFFDAISTMLEEVSTSQVRKEVGINFYFIPMDEIENGEGSDIIGVKMEHKFLEMTKFKGNRIKISGEIHNHIEDFMMDENVNEAIREIAYEPISKDYSIQEDGIILTKDGTVIFLFVNKVFYRFRTDFTISKLLTTIMSEELATHLRWKTKRALVSIKGAKCYEDTEYASNPIRLIASKRLQAEVEKYNKINTEK